MAGGKYLAGAIFCLCLGGLDLLLLNAWLAPRLWLEEDVTAVSEELAAVRMRSTVEPRGEEVVRGGTDASDTDDDEEEAVNLRQENVGTPNEGSESARVASLHGKNSAAPEARADGDFTTENTGDTEKDEVALVPVAVAPGVQSERAATEDPGAQSEQNLTTKSTKEAPPASVQDTETTTVARRGDLSAPSPPLLTLRYRTSEEALTPEMEIELKAVVTAARQKAGSFVLIEGHADQRGEEAFNLYLSQNRARAVAAYLESQGIENSRISWKGFGSSRPLVSGDSLDAWEQNRRVEIRVQRDKP